MNWSSELESGALRSGNFESICARTRGSAESATPSLVRSRAALEGQKRPMRRTAVTLHFHGDLADFYEPQQLGTTTKGGLDVLVNL